MEISQLNSPKTNVRYFILLMLFIVTTMNYVDRATLSMAAPAMRKDLGLDAVTMGYAFSAFGWSYTALQIPGGWLLDKFGAEWCTASAYSYGHYLLFFKGWLDLLRVSALLSFCLVCGF